MTVFAPIVKIVPHKNRPGRRAEKRRPGPFSFFYFHSYSVQNSGVPIPANAEDSGDTQHEKRTQGACFGGGAENATGSPVCGWSNASR